MQTATAEARWTKLNDGKWGVRVNGTTSVGATLRVVKASGESSTETVTAVLWSGIAKDGQHASLVAIEQRARAGSASPRGGRRTGCSCGSREDAHGQLIPSARNCWTCKHDGE